MDRPALDEITDGRVFRSYYYLLSELKAYCKERGLSAAGGKQEIADRIAHFIDTGEALRPAPRQAQAGSVTEITVDTLIEPNIRCTEVHRRFFQEAIGKGFTFNVAFQNWLKENAGKPYGEAVAAYHTLKEAAKQSQTVISKQFEYNTYIRDFFADNAGRSLDEAIRCWKHKKALPGHNRYEASDLSALG